jgi:hypothetical protein
LAERRATIDRYLRAFEARRLPESTCADRPEQLKQLLDAVVEQIQVESCACIQPYFVAPTVRTRIASRRRTTKHTNTGAPGPMLWVNARGWGHAG